MPETETPAPETQDDAQEPEPSDGADASAHEFIDLSAPGISPDDLALLSDPFPLHELQWRVLGAGIRADGDPWLRVTPWIDGRAVQDRLDDVCGPACWQTRIEEDGELVTVGIAILVEGEWIEKWDGTGRSKPRGTSFSQSDAGKGDVTAALKRAASAWGIGRYLHHLPIYWPKTYRDPDTGFRQAWAYVPGSGGEDRVYFSYDVPEVEPWALPGGAGRPPPNQVNRLTGEVGEGVVNASDVQELLEQAHELGAEVPTGVEQKIKDAVSSRNPEHLVHSETWLRKRIDEIKAAAEDDLPF